MENRSESFELEDMRQQIQLLKAKLEKETIVSEKLIRQSTQDKVSYIDRKKKTVYVLIGFALVYCNVYFILMGYSWIFVCLLLVSCWLPGIFSVIIIGESVRRK